MPAATRKEVAKSIKTLLVMLQSMRDQQIAITLRNDSIVYGTIKNVDSNMNVTLIDAVIELDPFYFTTPVRSSETSPENVDEELDEQPDFRASPERPDIESSDDSEQDSTPGNKKPIPFFILKGSRIRHIDLPNYLDPIAEAKQEIERMRHRTRAWTKTDIVRKTDQP